MARKKRSKCAAKKAREKKKAEEAEAQPVDENVDDPNKLERDDEASLDQPIGPQEDSSRSDSSSSIAPPPPPNDKVLSHKRFGKFRCLERRRSSSAEDDQTVESNSVSEDLNVTYQQYDTLDGLMSDDVACDITIEDSVEEVREEIMKVKVEDGEEPADLDDTFRVNRSETVKCYSPKKQLVLPENVTDTSATQVNGDDPPVKMEVSPVKEENEEETKEEAKVVRRRSTRIRMNRWDEAPKPVKVEKNGVSPVMPAPPSPHPSDSPLEKPVKVKSRWRRTSELEMSTGGETGSLVPDPPSPVTLVAPIKLPLLTVHPEIQERLKTFEIIDQSLFLTIRSRSKEAKRMTCDCVFTKEEVARGEPGCGDDCLNRLLMIECGSRCVLGNLCSNKRFQNRQYTKCEVAKTVKKGLGLICSEDTPSGAFLMEYVGEVIDSREFRRRAKEYAKEKNRHFYFMALKSDTIIDATMKGNISRFINHSCDPNSETQKWTVNGELRIGFFSIRPIAKGEEVTFDYQLQRYGKEAQRCYCESANCRGWIGEDPEKEDKEEKDKSWGKTKEKREKKMRREDLEEEIEKLKLSGVKNQKETLQLNRLMVRAEDHTSRSQLLSIILSGIDHRCLRLFVDYHGLGLLWSWMVDSTAPTKLNIQILDTLAVLPITNKTILKDSKVLSAVEKWAEDNPADSMYTEKKERTAGEDSSPESEENGLPKADVVKEEPETEASPTEEESDKKTLNDKAKALIEIWAALKEEFRIPKKERIEQMKEHEREADRGYVDPEKSKADNQSYDRHWSFDREGIASGTRRIRRAEAVPELPRNNGPKMTKMQRRHLFALKVEEEERQKRLTEERWAKHQEQCFALGVDPATTVFPPHNGYFHPPPPPPQPICHQENEMFSRFPPPFIPPFPPPGQPHFHPGFPQGPPPPRIVPGYPCAPPFPPGPLPPNHQGPLPPHHPPPGSGPPFLPPQPGGDPQPSPFVPKIPPRWKAIKDDRGATYYYHVKVRRPQWTFPDPLQVAAAEAEAASRVPDKPPGAVGEDDSDDSDDDDSDSEDDDSTTDEEDKDEEEDEDYDDLLLLEAKRKADEESVSQNSGVAVETDQAEPSQEPTPAKASVVTPQPKKRRDGLVQINIISPRDEDDDYRKGVKKSKIRETKQKLARQKLKLKARAAATAFAASNPLFPSPGKNKTKKVKNSETDASGPSRRIKDKFRVQMANVIVALLNPYRKPDCKMGRIMNTEDFKHLARKLTHFVMVKELKHIATIEELQCNDNVKHKARDFIKKYMSKFGTVYSRSSDD